MAILPACIMKMNCLNCNVRFNSTICKQINIGISMLKIDVLKRNKNYCPLLYN